MSEIDDYTPHNEGSETSDKGDIHRTIQLSGMYESWFLDYASYVILERAVPDIQDGLKPVQRRIMHSMKNLDDGRYNKVANIIGNTMQFHPHGDASIGDALVQLGQKEILIDAQGNWGNVLTGDSAAASRYIEARISKFAAEVVFNPKTTAWKLSYDGRNKEPIALPVKFPLLLAQGVEGIAVGLASKILPHNFNELIDASISCLKNEDFELLPDFITGGMADCSKYNEGLRGGKVRVRAKISQVDRKMLVINEIPFGTTTTSLIESIIAANDKGKIKVKKIDDNTAEKVEIMIHLASGVSPDQTIDALFAFTQCEVSISPNSCVIAEGKPAFWSVHKILEYNTNRTLELLQQELQIRLQELEADWHGSSLEKIFIEQRIYRDIEQSETWEDVILAIDAGLKPFIKNLRKEVTRDDIARLTEIKIKRISKYNTFKADEHIRSLEEEMEEVKNHLDHIVDYTINFFRQIKKKYGAGRERKTELRSFDNIEAASVAANNEKLYVNRIEGFAGTSLKKDEFVCDCSDLDDMIVFRENGTFLVTKVNTKTFVGENIIHIDIFRKNDDRTIYNMVYRDGRKGPWLIKRFAVLGVTRDKEYQLTAGTPDSKVVYFSANPNGEAETIKVLLRPKPKLKKLSFEFDFAELAIKGRSAKGNILTKHAVRQISKRDEGVSTLKARDIWYDESVKRLTTDERGNYLGAFGANDKLLQVFGNGEFKLTGYELSTHFDDDLKLLRKFDPDEVLSVIYVEGETQKIYLKRFQIEEDIVLNRRYSSIGEHPQSVFKHIVFDRFPMLDLEFDANGNGKKPEDDKVSVAEFIGLKSYKAKGKRLSNKEIIKVTFLEPLTPPDEIQAEEEQIEETSTQHDDVEQDVIEPNTETSEQVEKEEENKTEPKTSGKKPLDPPAQMELEF
ncbi:MAG: DNA gyrase/topoisomerase IV subunit A [Bacteroidetes bacterium]|nr:DNA gyrase/topoisomerase IV subunit A [Bacteroidota bacterium]MBU1577835.1 DNA gyrase/topoisomerase IV subunit A [Bacteroidota bacterium]MBU2558005.1 DNA gyrase/topoisomerase IV subunit A [Bacteroidota bacterium]